MSEGANELMTQYSRRRFHGHRTQSAAHYSERCLMTRAFAIPSQTNATLTQMDCFSFSAPTSPFVLPISCFASLRLLRLPFTSLCFRAPSLLCSYVCLSRAPSCRYSALSRFYSTFVALLFCSLFRLQLLLSFRLLPLPILVSFRSS